MAYVLFSLFLFCASVAAHIFFCRRASKPGLQAKTYILIFIFFAGVYVLGVFLAGQAQLLDPHSLWGLPFQITAGLISVLLAPVYVSFYALTQLMSPSKKILLSVSRHGSLSHQDILAAIEEEDFINTRLNDLIASGCVSRTGGGGYVLTPSGRNIAVVLNVMQRFLGRGMGG